MEEGQRPCPLCEGQPRCRLCGGSGAVKPALHHIYTGAQLARLLYPERRRADDARHPGIPILSLAAYHRRRRSLQGRTAAIRGRPAGEGAYRVVELLGRDGRVLAALHGLDWGRRDEGATALAAVLADALPQAFPTMEGPWASSRRSPRGSPGASRRPARRAPPPPVPAAHHPSWALAGRLAQAMAPHLGGALVIYFGREGAPAGAEGVVSQALDRLAAVMAAPREACPHAAEGEATPLVACAWRRSLSCAAPGCLGGALALPRGRERRRCDLCGHIRRGQPLALVMAVGGAVLLARLCREHRP